MLLTNMAIRPRTEQERAPDGQPGRTEASFQLTMDWVASPEEVAMLTSMFNQGKPTAAFWEALEWGSVPDSPPASSQLVAISVRQAGDTGPKRTVTIPLGAATRMDISVAGRSLDGQALGTTIPLDVEVRSC